PERPLCHLLGSKVRRVLELVPAQPLDLAEAVEREGPDLPAVALAAAREIESLLVDQQRVRLEDEGLAVARDALLGDAQALLAQERGHDVVDVLEPPLVEVARLVHVEDLAIEVPDRAEVLAAQR